MPNVRQFYEAHHVTITGTSKDNLVATCPFCEKEKHFYIGPNACYDCKVCGVKGNAITFLEEREGLSGSDISTELKKHGLDNGKWNIATNRPTPNKGAIPTEHIFDPTTTIDKYEISQSRLKAFADGRRLPVEILKKYQLGWDNYAFTLPIWTTDGKLTDIRRRPPGAKEVSKKNAKLGIFAIPNLLENETVYVAEGCCDAMMLESQGYPAIGVCGAGQLPKAYAKLFEGKMVVFVYDSDDAGRQGVLTDAAKIQSHANEIKTVDLTPYAHGKEGFDVTDFFKDDGTSEKFRELIAKARTVTVEEPKEEIIDGFVFGNMIEQDGVYNKVQTNKDETVITPITTFTLKPILYLKCPDGDYIQVEVIGKSRQSAEVVLPPGAWITKAAFQKAIPYRWARFKGSDNHIQMIGYHVGTREDVPERQGLSLIGWHDTGLWVTPDGVLNKNGVIEDPDIAYLPTGVSLETMIHYRQSDDFRPFIQQLYQHLPRMNDFQNIHALVGWFAIVPLAASIRKALGHFPLLNVYGTKGSGKSSTLRELWRMHGINAELFSCTKTRFTLLRLVSCTNGVPVILDEFKPWDMRDQDHKELIRFLRRIYDGEIDERGNPDQSVTKYVLSAPVAIAGEVMLDQSAMLERIIPVPFSPNTIQGDSKREAFNAFSGLPLEAFPTEYIPYMLSLDVQALLDEAGTFTKDLVSCGDLPLRIFDALKVISAGLLSFEQFGKRYDCDISFLERGLLEISYDAILRELLGDEGDGYGSGRTALDEFLEQLSIMAEQGRIKQGHEYHINGNKTEIWLHLKGCLARFTEWARQTGYVGEIYDHRAYLRMIRENTEAQGYIKAVSESKKFKLFEENLTHFRNKKAFVVDKASAEGRNLDLSGFDE